MSDQATQLGPKFFIVGTYVQSAEMMDTWKARGINTLVGNPEGSNVDQWSQAAASKDLYMIRSPSNNLTADLNNPYLLAWSQQDEPSNTTTTLDYGAVVMDPKELEQEAASWRAAADAAGKDMPVWANHVGGHIYPDWGRDNALMKDYMQGSESDWLSSDSYPIQEHQPFVIKSNDGYTSTTQGITLDRQIAWSGGKPVQAFIGTSAYNDSNDVPTAGEFNAMAWSSVIHGASGIIYFPVDLSPWDFDATPPELVQAMTAFDSEIASIDKILMNETMGGRDPATIYRSANQGATPQAGQLPWPFEATEIKTADGTYRIILNLSDKPATFNKPEWGMNNVSFGSYEAKKGYGADLGAPETTDPAPTPTLPVDPVPVPPEPTPEHGNDTGIILRVSGDQYQGSPKFNVIVDGKTVATGLTATASHNNGDWAEVTVDGDYSGAKKVEVVFTNDTWGGTTATDRNLYVDSVEIAGKHYEGEGGLAGGNTLLTSDSAVLLATNDKVSFTVAEGTTNPTVPAPTQPAPAPIEKATFSGVTFNGTYKADTAVGNDLDNVMKGGSGNDTLKGAAGNDRIDGGSGDDKLWGGSGNDQFVFNSNRHADGDQVEDFSEGDVFGLSTIDAMNTVRGNQAFKFIGSDEFTTAGQIRFEQDKTTGVTHIEGNTDHDAAPEFTIEVNGLHSLTAADFVL